MSFPTSYIKTENSQATRASENASVNTLTPWFNGSGFTLECVITPAANKEDVAETDFFFELGADGDNYLAVFRVELVGDRVQLRISGVTAQIDIPSSPGGEAARYALSYDGATIRVARNGTSYSEPQTGALVANYLQVMGTPRAPRPMSGVSSKVVFRPRALSATELEALTS